ncbi:MAG: chloride channel protein [Lentisphaerae bacterium GWF2_38_69]|nr:MAG: chloride channel protein [Lentisphaerae bacterium GWF2_38_69]
MLAISGILVGGLTGLIGAYFQLSIAMMGQLKSYIFTLWQNSILWQWGFPVLFSLICILVSLFIVKKYAPETSGSGVQEIEGVLSNKRILRWKRVLPIKFIGGVLTLASGAVTGREGPTIHMGGAIGEMLSRKIKIEEGFTHTFIAAGAAAGLAAAFNAPLAGILFVIEEMRPHFKYSFMSMQCVILASLSSTIVLRCIIGQEQSIPMTVFVQTPSLESIWLFIIFGAIFGIMGVVFNKYLIVSLNYFSKLKPRTYWLNITIVGIGLGLCSNLFPEIIGGGYEVIPEALKMQIPVMLLGVIFLLRLGTTWISYGSGIPGGIFAPMLALGTLFGMFFGHFAQIYFPGTVSHPAIFAVAGMSALFAATVGAPLTGIILVAEMTLNYELLLPLILTCFSATIVSYLLGGKPVYETLLLRTLRLAKEKGENIITNRKEKSPRKIRKHHPGA